MTAEVRNAIFRSIATWRREGGVTLKSGKPVSYKTGYQVATDGVVVDARNEARIYNEILRMGGDCGLWFSEGKCYIDRSHRVNTKREAIEEGRAHNQLSVLKWATMECVAC